MSTPINILVCGNGPWSPHIATTLLSVRQANPNRALRFLIGALAISDLDRERIQSAVPEDPITWIEISMAELDALPDRRASKYNFIELLAIHRLPPDVERVLTIDADVIVLDDLAPLWEVDLAGRTFAAARCAGHLWIGRSIAYFTELGIDGTRAYLQSGVKVIDLPAWRERDIHEKAFAHLDRWHDSMRFGDQELLNAVIDDDWIELPLRWNSTTHTWAPQDLVVSAFSSADLLESRTNPGIVHFADLKPWQWSRSDRDALRWLDEWERLAFASPFRDWYSAERERGLAELAQQRPRKRSLLRRLRKAGRVLLHG